MPHRRIELHLKADRQCAQQSPRRNPNLKVSSSYANQRLIRFFATEMRGNRFRNRTDSHTTVYSGMKEALASMQHLPNLPRSRNNGAARQLAVLTNKPVIPARLIVQALGLGPFFAQIYGGNSFPTKKPDPAGALQLLHELGTKPEDTAIVGDSHVDIETGRNAGLWTVGLTYGFAPHSLNDPAPDALLDTPHELAELFAT